MKREEVGNLLGKAESCVQSNWVTRALTSHTVLAFFYGTFLFLYELRYLRQTVPAIHPILIAWAGMIVVYDVAVCQIWRKIPHWKMIALFVLTAGTTAVMTMEVGLVSNIKGWIFIIIPLVIFYPVCLLEPTEKRNKALIQAMLGAAFVIFVASTVAVGMYLLRFSQEVTFMGETWTLGIRHYIPGDETTAVLLYGIYTDTNHAAAYAIFFAVYSVILFRSCQKGMFRKYWQNVLGTAFSILNFVAQICYFPLANSRGGWLCLLVGSVICVCLWCCAKLRVPQRGIRVVAAVLVAIAATGILYGCLLTVRSGLSRLSMEIAYGGNTDVTEPAITEPAITEPAITEPAITEPAITEPIVQEDSFAKLYGNSGSGRLGIWKEGLTLFTKRSLFGTGPGNNAYYADMYDVGYYLAEGDALHNSYLDLLVDYGIVGFLTLIGFWSACLWTVCQEIYNRGRFIGMMFYLSMFMVLFVAGISVFLSCTFINTTAMYYIMLLPCGYLMAECTKK